MACVCTGKGRMLCEGGCWYYCARMYSYTYVCGCRLGNIIIIIISIVIVIVDVSPCEDSSLGRRGSALCSALLSLCHAGGAGERALKSQPSSSLPLDMAVSSPHAPSRPPAYTTLPYYPPYCIPPYCIHPENSPLHPTRMPIAPNLPRPMSKCLKPSCNNIAFSKCHNTPAARPVNALPATPTRVHKVQ